MIGTYIIRSWLLIFVTVLFSACSSSPRSSVTAPANFVKKPKIGLALGGGAAKGFAHIGVIKVLEAAGLTPDLVTGTSAGSVVGSLYASGLSGMQLQSRAMKLDEANLVDWTFSSTGVIKGERLKHWINAQVANKTIEQLPRPFGVVATELDSGRKVVFRRGNTGQAVCASASVPNVFMPVKIGSTYYVDGGLVSPVPVSAAREMGADFVIAVDISSRPRKGAVTGFLSMLDQSLNIMNGQALAHELHHADVVIRPQVQNIGTAQFDARHQAILEGERAAQAALPLIRHLLQTKAAALNK